ncbi:MAG: flagellar hook protein FlgE [Zoogloeaceae bacterium]|jgi:flagellar hook protein FlgE|nr:flagellar hook protein FlgE [Zoogloeaceae bacterium]
MAFQQGLSGLNVYAKGLDVVSHNIANASTVGFKASSAHFADVYAGALNGSANSQIGIGVSLMAVQQQFTQGNASITGYGMDMMINGNGFFRFQKSPADLTPYYSRNGQFHLDKDGYIVNSNSCFLTGYDSPDGETINTASIVPLTVGTGAIPPKQTGWSTLVDQTRGGLAMGVNLDARDERSATTSMGSDWEQLTAFAWNATFQSSMFNYSTPAAIYDQAGTLHTLTNYYVRQGDTGAAARTWDVYTVIDDKYLVSATPNTLVFNADGTLSTTNARFEMDMSQTILQDGTIVDLTADAPTPPATVSYNWFNATTPGGFAFYLDLSETTQFGMPNNVDSTKQDGYIAGSLTNLSVSPEGYVMASYSNGQNKMMGQVILAEFANPHGLQSTGNNMWIETYTSGQATIGEPGGGTRGIIQSGSVEDSNTDLTQELVNMIVMQRNYQANAQTIRTQDQILQTLVNLR